MNLFRRHRHCTNFKIRRRRAMPRDERDPTIQNMDRRVRSDDFSSPLDVDGHDGSAVDLASPREMLDVHDANIRFEPGRNCWRVESAERAAFLIDGQVYFS